MSHENFLKLIAPPRWLDVRREGMKDIASFGFLGIMLSVWLYSSVTEEVFVRGWFQSGLIGDETTKRARILASGVLFGSMHLSLIWKGADPYTVIIIVGATTLLGFVAAHFRERHATLVPAIATHIAFNVDGLLAGIVLNILSMTITGRTLTP